MRGLLIATALVALGTSAATAEPGAKADPTVIAPAPASIIAACRIAGDAATPRPERAHVDGHLLIIDGGDRRELSIDNGGHAVLHCVNAWFRARWERERP